MFTHCSKFVQKLSRYVQIQFLFKHIQIFSYLSAEAEIGELEHSLTTDLLNHLVFVQKVFMKEVRPFAYLVVK